MGLGLEPIFSGRILPHASLSAESVPVLMLRKEWLFLALLAGSVGMTGCRTTIPSPPPPIDLPEAFSQSGEADRSERWWRALGDARLEVMIQKALSENFSLRAAWDRLQQARASLDAAGADLWPTLDAGFENEFSWRRELVTVIGPDGDPDSEWEINDARNRTINFSADYEIDLWGRVRSLRNAEALDLAASAEDLHAAAISLAAQVASLWFELQEQVGQRHLLEGQIKTAEETLKLIEARFRLGQILASDVLQQRQFVEARREEKSRVNARIAALEIALAILVGETPRPGSYEPEGKLIELPPLPQTGLPADLVSRRPDVRSAYLAFQAADQRAAAALADRYPRLSLTAGFSTSSEDWRALFDNWLATVAANLVAPVIDGGARRAEVRRNRAVASEQFNDYGQTLLDALGEVEEALVQESHQRNVVHSIELQLELASRVLSRIRAQYLGGGETFLRVLEAQQSVQDLERELLSARRELIGFRIDLYRALAGGWDIEAPGGEPVVADEPPADEKKPVYIREIIS